MATMELATNIDDLVLDGILWYKCLYLCFL
jgi:hypothetical protein